MACHQHLTCPYDQISLSATDLEMLHSAFNRELDVRHELPLDCMDVELGEDLPPSVWQLLEAGNDTACAADALVGPLADDTEPTAAPALIADKINPALPPASPWSISPPGQCRLLLPRPGPIFSPVDVKNAYSTYRSGQDHGDFSQAKTDSGLQKRTIDCKPLDTFLRLPSSLLAPNSSSSSSTNAIEPAISEPEPLESSDSDSDFEPDQVQTKNRKRKRNSKAKSTQPSTKKRSCSFRGVSPNGNLSWKAEISHKGKRTYLGSFKSADKAAEAYATKYQEIHGRRPKL
jgi:hypothetical protein